MFLSLTWLHDEFGPKHNRDHIVEAVLVQISARKACPEVTEEGGIRPHYQPLCSHLLNVMVVMVWQKGSLLSSLEASLQKKADMHINVRRAIHGCIMGLAILAAAAGYAAIFKAHWPKKTFFGCELRPYKKEETGPWHA